MIVSGNKSYNLTIFILLILFISGCLSRDDDSQNPGLVNLKSNGNDQASFKWTAQSYAPMEQGACYTYFDSKIFILGGAKNNETGNDVLSLNIDQGVIEIRKNMKFKRSRACAAEISMDFRDFNKKGLFVFGGLDNMGNILKKAEIYDPETCSWASLPDAPFGLRDAQCMGAGTFAVILGGKKNNDETNFSPLIFNFTTNTWKTGKKTLNLKSRGGICSFENKILWAGGMDSDQAGYMIESRSIQAYDPVTDEWSHFIDMPFSASDCGIVYHNGYLLCAGGTNQESANNKAAVYDIQNAQWTAADDLIAGSGEDSFMFIHSGLFYYGPGIVQVFR